MTRIPGAEVNREALIILSRFCEFVVIPVELEFMIDS